ncbi:MAG TPA: phosphatidylglycerol lysyltransferase domain-containing protein [Acidimicrobiales bacterium]|nr:phosphatidylglycerol lysyltransferase domain-containing protein [Acidimicrobiales bacterium]
MTIVRSVLRIAGLVLATIVTVSAALGWLYWIRIKDQRWPGPRIAALPLDELAHHDTVSIFDFLIVFIVASAVLGLVARAWRTDRLTAVLVLGITSGLFLFLHEAVSYYVVRQISISQSLDLAAASAPIYLGASMIAIGGALLGRPNRSGSAVATLAATAVAVCGVLDVVASFANFSTFDLTDVAPSVLLPLSSAIDLPVGLLLVVSSRGLARRNRNAWRVAVFLLGVSSLAHLVLFRSEYGYATLTLLVAAVLIARRSSYDGKSEPGRLPTVAARLLVVAALTFSIALLGALIGDIASNLPLTPARELTEALRALAAQPLHRHDHSPGAFGSWFPWSVAACLVLGVLWAAVPWLAPWRPHLHRDHSDHELAAELVRREGRDSLAPFLLRLDKQLFFWSPPDATTPTESVVIAYRVVRGVALVSGAPVGPDHLRQAAMQAFAEHARRRGWTVAVLGVPEPDLPLFDALGFLSLYHGNEALIDVARFSLSGKKMKAVRQAVTRVERNGYQAEVVRAGEVGPELRAEIVDLERAWLNGGRKKGFAMELDDLFRLDGDDAVFVLGRDSTGALRGYLHLAHCPASATLSLSSMPRLPGVPNGFISWLIVRAIEWSAAHGTRTVSLNFSPLAELFEASAELSPLRRVERRALLRLKAALSLQLDNLLLFNRQFCPSFARRFLIVERWGDVPRVVLAAMSAEGYLPFSDRVLGWPARGRGRNQTGRRHDRGVGGRPQATRGEPSVPAGWTGNGDGGVATTTTAPALPLPELRAEAPMPGGGT